MSILRKSIFALMLLVVFGANAQNTERDLLNANKKKKLWELGVGVDVFNISRTSFHDFHSLKKGHVYNLELRNIMFGGNIYVARQLNKWFYADVQATMGATPVMLETGKDKNKLFGAAGLGLQFRLTPLFKKDYVEPYLRLGANYMYKDFTITRSGKLQNIQGDFLQWGHSDWFNSKSNNKKHLFLASLGFGVNSWFNEKVGFGIQGDYMTTLEKNRLGFPRVLARVMLRFGKSKEKPEIKVEYVEKIVYKEIEKPVVKEVVKYVEKEQDPLYALFSNINFDFDKYDITPESAEILDKAAAILKTMKDKRFLITGHTDNVGSLRYNERLSVLRAKAVVDGLLQRGVPANMIKSRGVGKRIAAMPVSETHIVREGDRKVTIEYIKNMQYWDKL